MNPPRDLLWRKSSFTGSEGNCVEVAWRTSSFSGTDGNCVEVGWNKSSFSAPEGDCVEVALLPVGVAIRDSKNTGPNLAFPTAAWRSLIEARS